MHANPTVNYIGHIDILASTLYFASVAFFLRYQLLQEKNVPHHLWYYRCSLFVRANLCLDSLCRPVNCLLSCPPVNPNRPVDQSTSRVPAAPSTAFNWRAISFLCVWMAVAILATGTSLSLEYLSISSLSVVFSAPFCILLANIILPGFYTCDQRKTRALAALGCAILSVMVVLWSLALKNQFQHYDKTSSSSQS